MLLFTISSSTSSCQRLQRPGARESPLALQYACSAPKGSPESPAAANRDAEGVLLKLPLLGRASRGSEGRLWGVGEPEVRSAVSRTPVKGVGLPMGLPAYFGDTRVPGVLLPHASAGCCWLALLLLLLRRTLGHMGEMGGPAGMISWEGIAKSAGCPMQHNHRSQHGALAESLQNVHRADAALHTKDPKAVSYQLMKERRDQRNQPANLPTPCVQLLVTHSSCTEPSSPCALSAGCRAANCSRRPSNSQQFAFSCITKSPALLGGWLMRCSAAATDTDRLLLLALLLPPPASSPTLPCGVLLLLRPLRMAAELDAAAVSALRAWLSTARAMSVR